MNNTFKNVMFDKMLRLTHLHSLLYRNLLLFILYFVIFHSQIPLLIIWNLAVVYFLVYCTCFLIIRKKKFENSVWNVKTIYQFLRIVHLLTFDFNSFSSSSYSFYLKIFVSATLFQTYFQFLLVYSLFSPAAHQQHSVCHLPNRCLKGSRFHRQHLCYLETKKNIHQKFLLN